MAAAAFGTDNDRSALVAGTALHAPTSDIRPTGTNRSLVNRLSVRLCVPRIDFRVVNRSRNTVILKLFELRRFRRAKPIYSAPWMPLDIVFAECRQKHEFKSSCLTLTVPRGKHAECVVIVPRYGRLDLLEISEAKMFQQTHCPIIAQVRDSSIAA